MEPAIASDRLHEFIKDAVHSLNLLDPMSMMPPRPCGHASVTLFCALQVCILYKKLEKQCSRGLLLQLEGTCDRIEVELVIGWVRRPMYVRPYHAIVLKTDISALQSLS